MSEDQRGEALLARKLKLFEAEEGKLAARLAEATGAAQRQVQVEAEALTSQIRTEAAETMRLVKVETESATDHVRHARSELQKVQAELGSNESTWVKALREAEAEAVARVEKRGSDIKGEVAQAESTARKATAEVEEAATRLKRQLAQGTADASYAAEQASQEGIKAAQARLAELELRLNKAERQVSLREAAAAQMPRAVMLGAAALVGLVLGAIIVVLNASGRRSNALQEAAAAEVQADEFRAMEREFREEYGATLARRSDGEVLLTLPEGSRVERYVPVRGAIQQQGSNWRIDRD